ncbi:hypothetical protein WJX72_002893 [[Myrmecia] bisecta]|uniref:UPF3 domain-containing protein n=1 Tax=[Myrmecia] bisecta TaxID=41462 RepID=A0AAW1PGU1_9CHLO
MAAAKPARTKVVVRKLPPALKEADFLEVVNKSWEGRYRWFSFVQGKVGSKRTVYSRAYLDFTDPADVAGFHSQLDGHVFVSEKGSQYRCSVEYAPFQRVPLGKVKRDPREGTLEEAADYIAFVEELAKQPTLLPSAEIQLERREAEERGAGAAAGGRKPVVVTPLMQQLQEKLASKTAGRGGGRRTQQEAAAARDEKRRARDGQCSQRQPSDAQPAGGYRGEA